MLLSQKDNPFTISVVLLTGMEKKSYRQNTQPLDLPITQYSDVIQVLSMTGDVIIKWIPSNMMGIHICGKIAEMRR